MTTAQNLLKSISEAREIIRDAESRAMMRIEAYMHAFATIEPHEFCTRINMMRDMLDKLEDELEAEEQERMNAHDIDIDDRPLDDPRRGLAKEINVGSNS